MPVRKSRDLVLYAGDGGSPETFVPLGPARLVGLVLDNRPVEATALNAQGMRVVRADAGMQDLSVTVEGLFRDQAAEDILRAAAFGRGAGNYRIVFPNGDSYAAGFVVRRYTRGGSFEGLEEFTVTLQRTGGGTLTAA